MAPRPCPLCGYDAPEGSCPHCALAPRDRSLAGRRAGPWSGLVDGLLAVPRGLYYLATTPGVKRWLLPPFLVTSTLIVGGWVLGYRAFNRLVAENVPGDFHFDTAPAPDRWRWLQAVWVALLGAAEWVVNAGLALLASNALQIVAWFLLGTLVAWYGFSIVYEALAGPFLDEIQGRVERRFFGEDPRSRLERPNDLSSERAARLATLGALVGCGLFSLAFLVLDLGFLPSLVALPLGLLPPLLLDRRFGRWLLWVASVEGRATWASLQAACVTAVVLVLALPLYFVPVVGYFLFAAVAGFATAVSLLDIPLERRGWPLRMRLAFLAGNPLPLVAFGACAGFLLAVPVIGAVLMVPAASVGGLWLICRLDKGRLRAPGD